jgi:uncharacterized protein YifE (UPF0438 family)
VRKQKLFTDRDRELLKRWIKFYLSLDAGERAPTTTEQVHFVQVCRGQREPKTDHEKAYLKLKLMLESDLQRRAARQKSADSTKVTEVAHSEMRHGSARPAAAAPADGSSKLREILDGMSSTEGTRSRDVPERRRKRRRRPESLSPSPPDPAIPEFEDGMPRPGWFSDEGWNAMRRSYRNLGR